MKSFLSSLILLGAVQGFIVATQLFLSAKEKYSRKLLGWILLLLALACLNLYLNNIGFVASPIGALVDGLVPMIFVMPLGPLIYFYCRAELDPSFTIQKKNRIHFYPVIVDVFNRLTAWIFLVMILFGWVNSRQNNFNVWFDTYNVYADIPRWISLTVYLFFSVKLIRSSTVPSAGMRWLKELLTVFLVFDVIWLFYLVPYVIPAYTDKMLGWFDWYPIYIPMVIMIYWLGIRVWLINRNENQAFRNSKSTIAKDVLESLVPLLERAMTEEKLYRDPELNVQKLATHLRTTPKLVSAVINAHTGKSFNEYINSFRIEEIKARLLRQETKKFTIAALAFESGFNSQPTFQRAFKSMVGLTPKEFLEKHAVPAIQNAIE